MSKLPDSYPYLEPCLGCFENALQALSEQPGSPVFFGNGDFTLARLTRALGRLVPGAEVLICSYALTPETFNVLCRQRRELDLKCMTVFCNRTSLPAFQCNRTDDGVVVIPSDVNMFLLQGWNGSKSMTISGVFMQDFPSRGLELYTMHNDRGEQLMIRDTIYRTFRKQMNYARD